MFSEAFIYFITLSFFDGLVPIVKTSTSLGTLLATLHLPYQPAKQKLLIKSNQPFQSYHNFPINKPFHPIIAMTSINNLGINTPHGKLSSQKSVKQAWDEGKDFIVTDCSSPFAGRYINKTDALRMNVKNVTIRYAFDKKVFSFEVKRLAFLHFLTSFFAFSLDLLAVLASLCL